MKKVTAQLQFKKVVARVEDCGKTVCPHCGGPLEIDLEGWSNYKEEDNETTGS